MFSNIAQWTSYQCGRASTFSVAFVSILLWAATGPYFDYSDTWQLVINTATTIVTFLMVFLIQHTQTRDTVSIKLQLGELIRVTEAAHNNLISLDRLSEEQLEQLAEQYAARAIADGKLSNE